MKKLLCILTLSFASFGHAETTQVNIQPAALPQGMTQAQYQDLLINKKVEYAKAIANASAKAEASAKAKAAAYAKAAAAHEEAKRKAEIQSIAFNAIDDFKKKVSSSWHPPMGRTGEKLLARVILNDNGQIQSIVIQSIVIQTSHPDVKASVEKAIRSAAPFPMPTDAEARRLVRKFSIKFTVK